MQLSDQRCQGEEKVYLPDVVVKDQQYNFIGQESWQPLTVLEGSKCKRCGVYEEDQVKHDDVFDEWELCPIHFSPEPEGRYNHIKDKELNITFICTHCHPSDAKPSVEPAAFDGDQKNMAGAKKSPLVFVLIFFGMVSIIVLLYVGYMKWQEKKREEQQARFIKLFEDDEDLEGKVRLHCGTLTLALFNGIFLS
ncbi:hypothetical protein GOP47_0029356 [Adiantum capillus-veneris]|nr:hypothetical protein GOP47_0029356 [Adiantum capillus-veneris]